MTSPAISVKGLRKSYGDHLVLDGIDLDIPSGSVFALLGPNGAGKTTTVNLLTTLIRPDGGDLAVAGHDVRTEPIAVRSSIGVTGQFSAVDDVLTGNENLRLMADLHHLDRTEATERIDGLLTSLDMTDAADRPASTYSGGMRRRLDLAMTLLGRPRVIFLDEPTTGLDPRSRRQVWDDVRSLVAGGVTVFLTTQYLEEADALADRIAVLHGGRIVADGTATQLKARVAGAHIRFGFSDPAQLAHAQLALASLGAVVDDADLSLRVSGDPTARALRDLIDRIGAIDDITVDVVRPDLDDVFLDLTEVAR
jgi:ABC-2 type transport system ATP-binding protein